jgi:hypothetical protein
MGDAEAGGLRHVVPVAVPVAVARGGYPVVEDVLSLTSGGRAPDFDIAGQLSTREG